MRRAALVVSMALALGACSWFRGYFGKEEVAEPPAKLTDIRPELSVKPLWSASVGHGTDKLYLKLRPAYDAGRLFAADDRGMVVALDAQNGNQIWKSDTRAPVSAWVGVGEGLVLLGTSNGEILALGEDDGALRWRAAASSEVLASPEAGGGVVVARSVDGRVLGLDVRDGHRIWLYQATVPVLTLRGESVPVLDHGLVVVGLKSGKAVALSAADGKVRWEQVIAVPRGRSELERMVDIDADPVAYEGVLYVASFQGRVAALDSATGNPLWGRDISSYAGLAVDSRHVYVTDQHSEVWALDRFTGASVWKQDALHGRALTAPAVQGDSVVVGDFEGYLHWLSLDDGHIEARWRLDSDRVQVRPLVVDEVAYAYGGSGRLAALQITAAGAER
jgi:outer membrane protein assembly factor BamB